MTEPDIDEILTSGYKTCKDVAEFEQGDIPSLLTYQTALMALLPRTAEAVAYAEAALNRAKGEVANDKDYIDLPPTKLKYIIDWRTSIEQRTFKLAERLNRTVVHLLDSLNVKIPNERKLTELGGRQT